MTSSNPPPLPPNPPAGGKPFVGLHLKCCNVYVRAYVNQPGSAYTARCPRCLANVQIPIVAQGGSASRFFSAD